ncbi:hypothetical protein [Methanosarcina barkeri]|nr:hypothetical protein [Methanosarcina barkeri]
MPALEDICTYIISTENTYSGRWEELGDELILDLELPIVNHSEYLQMTLISLFSKISDLNHIDKLLSMYDKSSPTVRRKIVNAATKAHENYWLFSRRDQLRESGTWLRRSIILGASTFTVDERNAWLAKIIKDSNYTFLEQIVAQWVKNGGKI